jgi:hypothetical protein
VDERELPSWKDVGATVVDRARENPALAIGAALAAGYLLGGGLFSRSSRWLVRAAVGALAVPEVRNRVLGALRSRGHEPAAAVPF